MTLFDQGRIVAQLARGALSWVWRDTHYASPVPRNRKFMSPRDAAALIRDGDVVAASGLGGHQRASIIYWAIREAFEATGHPAGLTVMNLGGHGGRGLLPGTLEELGRPGLCTRLISSHFETFHAMLDLAAAGQCELQCIPFGTMALLFDALGSGHESYLTTTGVGTFIDPRVGPGSPVARSTREQLVTPHGEHLRYRIPKIDVAVFNLPAADRRGNLYATHAAMVGESAEIARAAKRNGGRVIANVGRLVDVDEDRIFLPADLIDAVVYYPDTEQTAGIFHREPWSMFTTQSDVPIAEALARVDLVNWLTRVTPRRSAADAAVARLAAAVLLAHVRRGASIEIGVCFPEQVSRIIFEAGRIADVTFLVESGAVGGLPAPGAYFGAALCPQDLVSSAQLFRRCYQRLDATCLGVLQADGQGNVNVSKRGDGPRNYVGPGGFIDLTAAAETIVFVSAWMTHAAVAVDDGRLRIAQRGTPKFVERVDEVTFNGARAVAAGKRVFYATHVGLFRLTTRGMELIGVMPGIDVRRDIMATTAMRIILPRTGRVPTLPSWIVTGEDFAPLTAARRSHRSRRAAP